MCNFAFVYQVRPSELHFCKTTSTKSRMGRGRCHRETPGAGAPRVAEAAVAVAPRVRPRAAWDQPQ